MHVDIVVKRVAWAAVRLCPMMGHGTDFLAMLHLSLPLFGQCRYLYTPCTLFLFLLPL
jgi:hypothetical protein